MIAFKLHTARSQGTNQNFLASPLGVTDLYQIMVSDCLTMHLNSVCQTRIHPAYIRESCLLTAQSHCKIFCDQSDSTKQTHRRAAVLRSSTDMPENQLCRSPDDKTCQEQHSSLFLLHLQLLLRGCRQRMGHPCYGQIEVNCIIVATGQFTHQLIILTGRYNRYASCWSQCRAQDVKHENCIYFCVHTIFNIKYKYKIYSFLASPAKVVLGKLLLLQELMTRP